MYSKESCNNLANIIHGHLDLSGLFTISIQQQQTGWWTRKEGRCLTVTRGWHWHNVTISGSDPRVWHGPLSQDSHSDSVSARVSHDADYKAGHVIIWTHLRAGPGSAHATGHSGLWGRWTAIIGFPSQAQALDHPHLDGARVLWKYFYCAQNNFCQHKYIFPQRFQSRQGKNQVVY